MKRHSAGSALAMLVGIAVGCVTFSWSSQPESSPAPVSVNVVVSVEAKHGKDTPAIYREDVKVLHGKDRLRVTGWLPLQGEGAGLELFLLIDDSADPVLGSQFDDVRKFIAGQPATTAIGVAYMRNGAVSIAQNLTTDHSLAAKALRMPLGAAEMASPYLAISDLLGRWPQSSNRREILVASSGIDALQPGSDDSYLDEAIARAQRAGVQVYSIYAPRAGHFSHSLWRFNWGQNNLSRLADETGAEAYFQGLGTPISYAPYLEEFAERLKHQYRLTFLIVPGKKAEYQRIALQTEVPNAELVVADSIYVPEAK